MDWPLFLEEWQAEAEARGFRVEVYGEVAGLPLLAAVKEGAADVPCVYLSSGIHGDEPAGPQALLRLLREDFFDESRTWLICPVLNPMGLIAGTRENVSGLDLNRDYHFCKSDEVCAHVRWFKKQRQEGRVPQLFLSLHEDWESSGFYFYEIDLLKRVSFYDKILEAARPWFEPEPSRVIDGHAVTKRGWIYHSKHPDLPEGWPEAIYLAKQGCGLSLTFETPSQADLESRIDCQQALVRAALKYVAL